MKKEDVLEASRKENEKKDPYVMEVKLKANNAAAVGMYVLAFFYLMYEFHTNNNWNSAIFSVIATYCCILSIYEAIKLERYRIINIISSIAWGIFAILLILDYFGVI